MTTQYTLAIKRATRALQFLIPILEKYNFEWVITGGFGAFVHGAKRPLTDIDIDIFTSKDTPEFQSFMKELTPFITQGLLHFVDQNYDNYNFEITYEQQIIDICPTAELKICNRLSGEYELFDFYKNSLPREFITFEGLNLPILPKELIIQNKEMLVWKRDSDFHDMAELQKLCKK